MYYEMVSLRAANQSLRSYPVFLKAFGNVAKGGGKFTERYIQCMNGCRVVPFDVTQTLNVIGTIITDTGQEGTLCFDRTTLTAQVDINYVPPQVEVIQISSGSGLSAVERDQLDKLYKLGGLDAANPLTVDDDTNRRFVGDSNAPVIDQSIITTGGKTVVTIQ